MQSSITRRMPAEWEAQEAVLLAFPHIDSDWGEILTEARNQFARLISTISYHGDKVLVVTPDYVETSSFLRDWFQNELGNSRSLSRVTVIEIPLNDTWTRDYGPLSVIDIEKGKPLALDFGFNAWGMKFKADKDNDVNSNLRAKGIIAGDSYVDCRNFILEGGSIETDGKGTLLTTSECLLNPNRNPSFTKEQIEKLLGERMGFTHFLWLDHGHIIGDDTDSHIDTLCRFAPDDVILYTSAGEESGPEYESLELMRNQLAGFRTPEGMSYHLIELPLPDPIHNDKGERMAATYANFLVTPGCVYVPTYGQPQNDRIAVMTIQMVYSTRKVVPVDCRVLITQGGSLHCSTMQIYPGIINFPAEMHSDENA